MNNAFITFKYSYLLMLVNKNSYTLFVQRIYQCWNTTSGFNNALVNAEIKINKYCRSIVHS